MGGMFIRKGGGGEGEMEIKEREREAGRRGDNHQIDGHIT